MPAVARATKRVAVASYGAPSGLPKSFTSSKPARRQRREFQATNG